MKHKGVRQEERGWGFETGEYKGDTCRTADVQYWLRGRERQGGKGREKGPGAK
jgi:hypothetical protein